MCNSNRTISREGCHVAVFVLGSEANRPFGLGYVRGEILCIQMLFLIGLIATPLKTLNFSQLGVWGFESWLTPMQEPRIQSSASDIRLMKNHALTGLRVTLRYFAHVPFAFRYT